jgi:hypothetical protein
MKTEINHWNVLGININLGYHCPITAVRAWLSDYPLNRQTATHASRGVHREGDHQRQFYAIY